MVSGGILVGEAVVVVVLIVGVVKATVVMYLVVKSDVNVTIGVVELLVTLAVVESVVLELGRDVVSDVALVEVCPSASVVTTWVVDVIGASVVVESSIAVVFAVCEVGSTVVLNPVVLTDDEGSVGMVSLVTVSEGIFVVIPSDVLVI